MAANGPIEQIQNTLNELAPLFQTDNDVHCHTRTIGARCRDILYPIEQSYALIENFISLEQVIDEIHHHPACDANVKAILATIKAKGNSIEPETGLNISTLLQKTWSLLKIAHYSDAEGVVIDVLRHNLLTKGGCLAGISARLVLPYALFLKSSVESVLGIQQHPQSFDELELATLLSLEDTKYDDSEQIMQRVLRESEQTLAVQIVNKIGLDLRYTAPLLTKEFDLSSLTEEEQLEHAIAASLRR